MSITFSDKENRKYDVLDLKSILREIGADDCNYLFIHSDIMFGKPSEGFKRGEYLRTLSEIVYDLNVGLIIPTFTYSFPNHEDYDVVNSRTLMGAFNEYIRKQYGRYRTLDPLLSLSVPYGLKNTFDCLSTHSLGPGSGLDVVHHIDGVKFLFLGAEMGDCFTYVHYVEKMMEVPYRFDMSFTGTLIEEEGNSRTVTQYIHTQCGGVVLPPKYDYFENEMEEKGFLKKKRLADKYVACISETDAYREIRKKIVEDKYFFVAKPYTAEDLTHVYTYDYTKGRITHC